MEGQVMSNKEYRTREGISSTDIKNMSKSMAYFKYCKDNPADKDTPALLFGRAYHKFCLEPDTFFDEFIIAPLCDKRTKEGKETYAKFLEEAQGKDVITQADFEVLTDMRNALYATPFCKKLIYGEHEKSFFWTDEVSGLECKCRPDSFGKIADQYICVDLKTTSNAETQAFMRDAIKLNYDIQASHYVQGLKANLGKDFKFIFIAQEKSKPYLVNILEADEYFMKSGKDTRAILLEEYQECIKRNEYPGYMNFTDEAEINSLGLPKWLQDNVILEESEEE